MPDYKYVWAWAKWPRPTWDQPGSWKGRRCRVLARSKRMNSALVEFDCGTRFVTSRNGLRRAKDNL